MSKCYFDFGSNSLGGFKTLTPIIGIDDTFKKIFVEPNPECFEDITNKIKEIPNSIFLDVAVMPENKNYEMLTRSDMAGDSAATTQGINFITDSIGLVNQQFPSYLTYVVKGMKISDIFKMADADEFYIKMDIEGAEYEVLEQFPFEYLPKIKQMFVEFHAHNDAMRDRRTKIIHDFAYLGLELKNWD